MKAFKVPKPTLERACVIEPHPYSSMSEVEERQDVMENGQIVSKVVTKQVRKSDRYKGMTVQDFSIQSQIAAGVQGSPQYLGSAASIDAVDGAIAAANSALDSLNSQTSE